MSNTSNLIHCQNGHVFSKKRYGTVCPYCNMETDTKEKRETQRSDVEIEEELFREDIKPVCGWIVCIDGPRQGKDYQIVQGKKFVGRAATTRLSYLTPRKRKPCCCPATPMGSCISTTTRCTRRPRSINMMKSNSASLNSCLSPSAERTLCGAERQSNTRRGQGI